MNIGKKIIELREKRGLSQYRLAKEAGVGQGRISQIESGKNPSPTTATLQKIAQALGVSMSEFDDNKSEAANLLPQIMEKYKTMEMNEEEKEAYQDLLKMSADEQEKELVELLGKLKSLPAEHRKALGLIIDSLSKLSSS
ncbi:MAG: family transcriptional regulator [Firmicutes bacterium]|nr:family transcriptional regulator [Bacillota bacterium]